MLEGDDMQAEIGRWPPYVQIAHDALYYLSRRWTSAPAPLDLSDGEGRKEFRKYLLSRMAIELHCRSLLLQIATAAAGRIWMMPQRKSARN